MAAKLGHKECVNVCGRWEEEHEQGGAAEKIGSVGVSVNAEQFYLRFAWS